MPFTKDEAVALAVELADLGVFIGNALQVDDAGNKRLNPDEAKELLLRMTRLAAKVAIDVLD